MLLLCSGSAALAASAPDLEIWKGFPPPPPALGPSAVGSWVSFRIEVRNVGGDEATDVTVTDVLPPGLSLYSATASKGMCSGTTTITCSLGSLAAGWYEVVFIGTIPLVGGQMTNTASVSSTSIDANPANNTMSITFTVADPSPPPRIVSLSPVFVGTKAITVNGLDFDPLAVVRVNGSERVTTFVRNTQLVAQLEPGDTATPGSFRVTVRNPADLESAPVLVTVIAPARRRSARR